MKTEDGFALPLEPETKVYNDFFIAHYQSPETLNFPPVVERKPMCGTVRPDGMTAVFQLPRGELICHLRQCRIVEKVIQL